MTTKQTRTLFTEIGLSLCVFVSRIEGNFKDVNTFIILSYKYDISCWIEFEKCCCDDKTKSILFLFY